MTIPSSYGNGSNDPWATSPPSTTNDRAQVAERDARDIAETAKQGVGNVAHETAQQARVVTGVAYDHARSALGETTSQLRERGDEQAQRAAAGLDQLAGQVQALLSGRPEEAGQLQDYAQELGDRARQLAERLRSRGVDGMLSDTTRFARRRPGLFLAGAASAGFVVGRMVKAQRSDDSSPRTTNGASHQPGQGANDYPYPQGGYGAATAAVPPMPDVTTPPAIDATPSVGAGSAYGTSRSSTGQETW